jgi:hypothetical protein
MKKSFIITSMAALAALCFSLTAQAQGPVVVSDKDDYSPGETALFQAAGFQPNELLDFSVAVQGDDGTWVPDIAWADVAADASGGAEVDYVVPDSWANKTLQLTVMGISSGLMAQTTFTDAPTPTTSTITGVPTSVAAGTPVPITATTTFNQVVCFPVIGCITIPTPVTGGRLAIEESTDGGATFNSIASENPTDGTLSITFDTTGLCGTSPQFRAHFSPAGSGFGESQSAAATLTIAACGPANQPPHIACLSPTVDLGAVVGCLGTGTGFGQSFPVSYTQSGTNPVTVTATFTLPDSSTVPVTVATISDPDIGDTVAVTLSGGTDPVVISGPGSGSAPFTVHIEAVDNHGLPADNNPQDCGGTANAQIVYNFNGFFPPLSGQVNTKVKQGSGLPVKFSITDCSGSPITTGNDTISVAPLSPIAPDGDPSVTDAGASNDNGINFRYDPTGMQWIYNLKTNSSYDVGFTYQITAHLDDGTDHNVSIAIKR